MKRLTFLLFIAYSSSIIFPGRLISNYCIGGQIENGKCKCPDKTALFSRECKPCVNGSIILNRCKCPKGGYLEGNVCKIYKVCSPGYVRLNNNTCIKKCPDNQIRVGNICKECPGGYVKSETSNECKIFKIYPMFPPGVKKPVIYLYPKETMDISVQLNIKNSKFTTIYPKFNDKNT